MNDIQTTEDIRQMVDSFYEKVNQDKLLSPVFNDFAKVDWESHLPKMYAFWNFLILGIPGYQGKPFPPHALLPVSTDHFNAWLELFQKNIDEQFFGPHAEMAKAKAQNIATTFQYKLGMIQ